MKYLSLFSGIGGFEIGIQNAFTSHTKTQQTSGADGHSADNTSNTLQKRRQSTACIGYSDIDKYANKVYERNFNGHRAYGDITTINEKELPDFDTVVGGFPCQAFSVAGKRAGFNDTRGTLFFDIARILAEKRPRHLVLENVKGLLNHDGGKTLQTIIKVLSDLGYRVEWQVLNSKDFGVPQNRERIIIIGHLRDGCGGQVFPIIGENESVIEPASVLTPDRMVKRQNGRRFKNNNEPTFTVNTQDRHGIYLTKPVENKINRTVRTSGKGSTADKHNWDTHLVDGKIRKLTPKECERLQGFPDDWTKLGIGNEPISDTQRYKMCGNAVTTNVIEAVFTAMIQRGCYE